MPHPLLYFHGGPGFNANPERHLLIAPFRDAGFDLRLWEEPSRLRPAGPPFRADDAFQNYLDSAEAFLLANYAGETLALMGHSFGCQAVYALAHKHPDKIARLFFVDPALAIASADRNVFTLTLRDYEAHGDPQAAPLRGVLDRYSGQFDANTEAGFALVAQNPRFLNYYWHNQARRAEFLAYYTPPAYQLDVEAFFAVRRSMTPLAPLASPIPATAWFGAHDIVVSRADELAVLQGSFRDLKVADFADSAHYPHIEEMDKGLAMLRAELWGMSATGAVCIHG